MSLHPAAQRVRVWDLPTRLFHWALAVLVVFSVVSARIGGNGIDWHMRSGYTILALVLFRVLWGLAGSQHARFTSFVHHPRAALRYARALPRAPAGLHVGHDPLGGLWVLALLALLLVQATVGLFANDSIASEGPLAKFISGATSTRLTSVHKANGKILYVMVAMHLAAIAYHLFAKRDNLITPMITGDKVGVDAPADDDGPALRLRALILLALSGGLVGYVISL